jgi:hypothetical protein
MFFSLVRSTLAYLILLPQWPVDFGKDGFTVAGKCPSHWTASSQIQ